MKIEHKNTPECIKISYSGEWNLKTVVEAAKEILPVLREWDCKRFLNDSSSSRLNLSRLEIRFLPGFLEAGGLDRSWIRAIVAPREHLTDYRYFEKLSREAGFTVKVFTEIGEADEWLNGGNKKGRPR